MWGEHTEKQFIYDRSKAELHTPRSMWASLLTRSAPKGRFKLLTPGPSPGLSCPLAKHPASFPTPALTPGPAQYACASFSQDGFQCQGLWEMDSTYYGIAPPPFLTLPRNVSARAVGEVTFTSRMVDAVVVSFYPSSLVSPCSTINLFVEVSGTQAPVCSDQGPVCVLPQFPRCTCGPRLRARRCLGWKLSHGAALSPGCAPCSRRTPRWSRSTHRPWVSSRPSTRPCVAASETRCCSCRRSTGGRWRRCSSSWAGCRPSSSSSGASRPQEVCMYARDTAVPVLPCVLRKQVAYGVTTSVSAAVSEYWIHLLRGDLDVEPSCSAYGSPCTPQDTDLHVIGFSSNSRTLCWSQDPCPDSSVHCVCLVFFTASLQICLSFNQKS